MVLLPLEPAVNSQESDLESLRSLVRELAARVERLERRLGDEGGAAETVLRAETPLSSAPPPPPPLAVANPLPAFPVPPSPVPHSAAPEVDLESRIGSHWLNRIGISAVLIGVSYFLKFAFDNNWIGPTGRVSIGLLAGIAVIVWSESFRRRDYKIFSYSLKAVGVGVLYLSLWAAFQVYGLIPSAVAFLAMAIMTAATAALAIKQDAEILAAVALTGGFATPLLLSTGQNREIQLFSYVALLSAASVVLVAFKPWRRLLVLSYAGTLVLYIAWYAEYYRRNEFAATLAFATIFFAIFAAAPLVSKTPEGTVSLPYLAGLITFVNTGVYFLQAYAMFEEIDKLSMAWFALALAAVQIGLSRIVRRQEPANAEALRLLHLALAVVLITIAIPIRLDGHWITMGWLVEAGVLLWVADRIGARFLHYLAAAALALGVARLLAFDNFQVSTLLLNSRMATYLLAMVVLALLAWFSLKREGEFDRQLAAVAVLGVSALALVGLSREIGDYYARQLSPSPNGFMPFPARMAAAENRQRLRIAEDFTYSALWMAYGALLMAIGFWRKSAFFRWQALFLIAATIVKVFIYDVSQLDRGYRILSFMILGVLLLAVSFVYQKDWLKLSVAEKRTGGGQS
ncbi:Membrane protein [Candidatus Sulfotelmatobacter sp. SbA7]|nr:Membrane protein [Candidatus Sulfotelmatobacter sp. SbA7]